MQSEQDFKNNWSSGMCMFVWMSGFQNPLAHTHFNMFVNKWTSANESLAIVIARQCDLISDSGVCAKLDVKMICRESKETASWCLSQEEQFKAYSH